MLWCTPQICPLLGNTEALHPLTCGELGTASLPEVPAPESCPSPRQTSWVEEGELFAPNRERLHWNPSPCPNSPQRQGASPAAELGRREAERSGFVLSVLQPSASLCSGFPPSFTPTLTACLQIPESTCRTPTRKELM